MIAREDKVVLLQFGADNFLPVIDALSLLLLLAAAGLPLDGALIRGVKGLVWHLGTYGKECVMFYLVGAYLVLGVASALLIRLRLGYVLLHNFKLIQLF